MSATDTSPVWKRVAWGLALVAVIFVGDRVMAAGLNAAMMGTGNRYAVIYRGEAPGGVLLLGNSRGVNTFHQPTIEEAIDRPVFNASFNGTSTQFAEVILRDYVERNPTPRLVVLEVTGLAAGVNQLQNFFPFGSESARLDAYLNEAVSPTVATARRLFHLYNYNGEMLFRSLAAAGATDQGEINRYTISPGLIASTRRETPEPLRSNPENLAALQEIVAFCEANDIELRLVIGPYLPIYRERIPAYDEWVASVREAAGGMRVWDYSLAIDDETAFADRVHMNYRGARQLTPILVADGLFDLDSAAPPDTTLTEPTP